MNKKILLASVLSLSTIVLAGEKAKTTATQATETVTTKTTETTTKATDMGKKAAETDMKLTLAGATDKNKGDIEKLAKEAGAKNAHYHNGALKVSPTGFDAVKFSSLLKEKLPTVTVQN